MARFVDGQTHCCWKWLAWDFCVFSVQHLHGQDYHPFGALWFMVLVFLLETSSEVLSSLILHSRMMMTTRTLLCRKDQIRGRWHLVEQGKLVVIRKNGAARGAICSIILASSEATG